MWEIGGVGDETGIETTISVERYMKPLYHVYDAHNHLSSRSGVPTFTSPIHAISRMV